MKILLKRKMYSYFKNYNGLIKKLRCSIHKSHKHIRLQLINDENHHTLIFISSLNKNLFLNSNYKMQIKETAFIVGQEFSKKINEREIKSIFFDYGNFTYSGRIQSSINGIISINFTYNY